jgi:hypothetical protein
VVSQERRQGTDGELEIEISGVVNVAPGFSKTTNVIKSNSLTREASPQDNPVVSSTSGTGPSRIR